MNNDYTWVYLMVLGKVILELCCMFANQQQTSYCIEYASMYIVRGKLNYYTSGYFISGHGDISVDGHPGELINVLSIG